MSEETTIEATEATESAGTETTATETATEGRWYDGLEGVSITDKDMESQNLSEYVKSTQNLRSMIDRKGIIPPSEGATDVEKAAFLEKVSPHLGENALRGEVPAADGYDVKALAENAALTDERRAGISEDFNAMGLTNEQANGVMELFGKQMALDSEMIGEYNESTRKSSEIAFKEKWGGDYSDRLAAADEAAKSNPELLAKLEKVGMSGDPDIIRLFDEIARATSEDSVQSQEARKATAVSDHKAYINSDEYKNMTRHDSRYSAGMKEYDAVMEKARNLLAKSMK